MIVGRQIVALRSLRRRLEPRQVIVRPTDCRGIPPAGPRSSHRGRCRSARSAPGCGRAERPPSATGRAPRYAGMLSPECRGRSCGFPSRGTRKSPAFRSGTGSPLESVTVASTCAKFDRDAKAILLVRHSGDDARVVKIRDHRIRIRITASTGEWERSAVSSYFGPAST